MVTSVTLRLVDSSLSDCGIYIIWSGIFRFKLGGGDVPRGKEGKIITSVALKIQG